MSGKNGSAKKRAYFRLTVSEAKEVKLLGSFNNWDPEGRRLKRSKKGVWATWMMLAPGAYEYRFLVDGKWQNDPAAPTAPNPYGSQNNVQVVA